MKLKIDFYFFCSIIIVLLLWQVVVSIFHINEVLFPTPIMVFKSFYNSDELYTDLTTSLLRLFLGSSLGIISGVLIGLITGHISFINRTFGQILNFFRFIPPFALIPLFLIWFGIGELSKVLLITLACFYPVWISTYHGVKNIEKKYLLVAKSLEIKKMFFIKEIVLKGSMNYILNGARIGIGLAFSVLIAAEMLGAYSGLGYRIFFLQSIYRVDMMVAYIIVIGALGMIFDKTFMIFSKKITVWKDEQ